MADVVTSYNGGAWTALAKMAERGAKVELIVDVAGDMGLCFEDCHEFDVEIFQDAYGDNSVLAKVLSWGRATGSESQEQLDALEVIT